MQDVAKYVARMHASKVAHAPSDDIQDIIDNCGPEIRSELRNQNILLTGATGFFGKWLTQTLLAMNEKWSANNKLTILTRNRARAIEESPWLDDAPNLSWIECDVRDLRAGSQVFSIIIHGATATDRNIDDIASLAMFETIVDGTKRILQLAESGSTKRLLLISSGAVYGRQPLDLEAIPETYNGGPDPLLSSSAYGEGKRVSEFLCATSARHHAYDLKIARCFAFVGPYLPLDRQFAVGNFIGNALRGEPIRIAGDGTAQRSYLYAADLMVWLLRILISGRSGTAYNVGSDQTVDIAKLAQLTHNAANKSTLNQDANGLKVEPPTKSVIRQPVDRYLPDVELAKKELSVKVWTSLESALEKTIAWHKLATESVAKT